MCRGAWTGVQWYMEVCRGAQRSKIQGVTELLNNHKVNKTDISTEVKNSWHY